MSGFEKDAPEALEGLFAELRSDVVEPTPDFMARILADAMEMQPEAKGLPVAQPERRGMVSSVLSMFGGWPAMAGLMTAAVTGIWIGAATPDVVNDTFAGLFGSDIGSALFETSGGFDFTQFEG